MGNHSGLHGYRDGNRGADAFHAGEGNRDYLPQRLRVAAGLMRLPSFRELREDVKALRRGEKRVAPFGSTGRVYAKRKPEPAGGAITPKSEPKLAISARVIRANGDIEDLGEVYNNG